jgi:hypothetical protein
MRRSSCTRTPRVGTKTLCLWCARSIGRAAVMRLSRCTRDHPTSAFDQTAARSQTESILAVDLSLTSNSAPILHCLIHSFETSNLASRLLATQLSSRHTCRRVPLYTRRPCFCGVLCTSFIDNVIPRCPPARTRGRRGRACNIDLESGAHPAVCSRVCYPCLFKT